MTTRLAYNRGQLPAPRLELEAAQRNILLGPGLTSGASIVVLAAGVYGIRDEVHVTG
jgi:hypothetical protein